MSWCFRIVSRLVLQLSEFQPDPAGMRRINRKLAYRSCRTRFEMEFIQLYCIEAACEIGDFQLQADQPIRLTGMQQDSNAFHFDQRCLAGSRGLVALLATA